MTQHGRTLFQATGPCKKPSQASFRRQATDKHA
jgi:hypothetical protein